MPSEEGADAAVASAAAAAPAVVSSPRASSSSKEAGAASSLTEAASALTGKRRTTRSGSVVVYPESGDVGKPKVFARQSFVVSGEEVEMADTILQARQLAGERRRSTFNAEDKTALEEEIAVVAQNLAARRASVTTAPPTDAAAPTISATVAVDPVSDADAVARRRSSVMKLPDNLRALVQQSDASGVQKKTASPYIPPSASTGTSQAAATTTAAAGSSPSLNDTNDSTASSNRRTQGQGWMSNVMAFIRWKKISTKPPKKNGREGKAGGSGGGASGGGDDGTTPRATPTPGGGGGRGVFGRKTRPLLPKQLPEFAGRKQLILDLDETLVHSSFKPVAGADFIMDIMVDGTFYKVFVLKRPGVDEFLERVAKLYEVIIFTASLPQYANPLLDLLDPKGTITSRLFREHCTFHEGYFVKDLTLLRHESLESTIIVDNSPMAYMFQPENAIDCFSWIENRADKELGVIADFLETIVNVPDVRDLLEFWREGAAVLDNVC